MINRICLEKSRTIVLPADVDGGMLETFGGRLAHCIAVNPSKPVLVFLCSWGGALDDGLAIVDLIQSCPAPIYTVGIGACYSAASMIVALAQEGRRYAGPHAALMFHSVKVGAYDELPKNVVMSAEFTGQRDRDLNREICERSKYKVKAFQTLMDTGKEEWLTAADALKKGVIDGIWDADMYAEVLAEIRGRK